MYMLGFILRLFLQFLDQCESVFITHLVNRKNLIMWYVMSGHTWLIFNKMI